MKYLLVILFYSFFLQVKADCLKDIFSIGVGASSASFALEESFGSSDINTESGINIFGSWIMFCPQSGIEYTTTIELRNYKVDNSSIANANVSDSLNLLNVRHQLSYLWRNKVELLGRFEIDEDIFFRRERITEDLSSRKAYSVGGMVGLKYNLFNLFGTEQWIHGLIGPRYSFLDESRNLNPVWELGVNSIFPL